MVAPVLRLMILVTASYLIHASRKIVLLFLIATLDEGKEGGVKMTLFTFNKPIN